MGVVERVWAGFFCPAISRVSLRAVPVA